MGDVAANPTSHPFRTIGKENLAMKLTHSLTGSWLTLVAGALAMAFADESVRAQRLTYSTHDWQLMVTGSNVWSSAWSDVKTPGDGRTYSLGTTWVDNTDENNFTVTFSGVGGTGSSSPTQGPGLANGAGAIAAILQVTDAQQNIVWQRFFHGDGGNQNPMAVTSTHARGISVFPAATPVETRIAICGETFDQRLPLSALQNGAESGLVNESAGFLAVYNGRGDLLWTYLFYGNDKDAGTVITDVAIHVDNRGPEPLDVVTYCGLSANGSYDPTPMVPTATPLTPLLPFTGPGYSPSCGDFYANGNETNHPLNPAIPGPDVTQASRQWDGIVGRLVRAHNNTGPITRRFHSIVGGYPDFEGLFGITEKSMDEFAVVGTTMSASGQMTVFPLFRSEWRGTPICLTGGTYVHGVIAEFDASLTDLPAPGGPGPLLLTASTLIGASGTAVQTVARDVLWHGGLYYVVGSTTGQDFTIGIPLDEATGLQSSLATGYLVATENPNQEFKYARYFPRDHNGAVSGLIGVAAWNEYTDHVSVFGWVEPVMGGPRDLYVASLFQDTIGLPPAQHHLHILREQVIQSAGDEFGGPDDRAGVFVNTGLEAPLGAGPSYLHPPGLGAPGGGGLSVDPRGLLTAVGSTRETPAGAAGYPVVPVPGGRSAATHPVLVPGVPRPYDAVRSVIDMLPDGAARSDGTGDPTLLMAWLPVGDGGTTPACARSPFGTLLGTTPVLKRMFLDYEGAPFPGAPVSFLVDQPPPASSVVVSSWQVGVPSPIPAYLPAHDLEVWVTGSAWGTVPMFPTGGSTRQVFTGVPPGFSYLVQYACLLGGPLTGTPCPGTDLTWAATPAMVFSY